MSRIHCRPDPLFAGLPAAFDVTRYHSLIARPPLPACLESIAETREGLIMAVRHRSRPLRGCSFIPIDLLRTWRGALANFVAPAAARPAARMGGSRPCASSRRGLRWLT
ncbi:MAG: hypothetical protein HPM95_15865 [Alphaproteobacteria bacterium]|nr:hypothetical protein [Alphaproteobacteria bacterium]